MEFYATSSRVSPISRPKPGDPPTWLESPLNSIAYPKGKAKHTEEKKPPDFCKAPAACNPAKLLPNVYNGKNPSAPTKRSTFFCHVYILLVEEMRLTTWDV